MMTFSEFKKYIDEHYLDYLPEEYSKGEIVFQKIKKNNGILLEGVTIKKSDVGGAPLQYLEHYYEEYQDGQFLSKILSDMAHEYVEHDKKAQKNLRDFSIMEISDFLKQMDRVTFRVINQKENRILLKDIPNISVEDLAKVYSIEVGENAAIRIDNKMLETWGIGIDQLDKAATDNTVRLKPSILLPLSEEMYVLTNDERTMGAATMFYPDLLGDIVKQLNKSFYIIPSSVNEVILIVDNGEITLKQIRNVVKEATKSIIAREEFLSDNIYKYDKENKKIKTILNIEPREKGFER